MSFGSNCQHDPNRVTTDCLRAVSITSYNPVHVCESEVTLGVPLELSTLFSERRPLIGVRLMN